MLDTIFLLFGVVLLLNFIKVLIKSRSPLKKAAFSMMAGVGTLAAASLLAGLLELQLSVNTYTVFVALVLGTPGVILVLLKMFFI
ncbi:MAG: pro-sigmaK processing inhibitor BofA family protein [Oscillospiraceae bacterium]|nr:pro-sigmaK processing inhibitor BofA family protein [Oscillospiraceae bacterium]